MGEIFNNRLLFKNNELLLSLLFSENFCVGGQGCDGGGQSRDSFLTPLGKTLSSWTIFLIIFSYLLCTDERGGCNRMK